MRNTHVPAQTQASFPSRPVWLPAHTVRFYCGRTFDALRCNEPEAETVLAAIGPACGPVITSALGYSDLLFPPGVQFREAVPRGPGLRMMPQGTQVDVPPLTATSSEGLYWRVRPGVGATRLADVAAALRPAAPPGAGRRAGRFLAERPPTPTWRPVR